LHSTLFPPFPPAGARPPKLLTKNGRNATLNTFSRESAGGKEKNAAAQNFLHPAFCTRRLDESSGFSALLIYYHFGRGGSHFYICMHINVCAWFSFLRALNFSRCRLEKQLLKCRILVSPFL